MSNSSETGFAGTWYHLANWFPCKGVFFFILAAYLFLSHQIKVSSANRMNSYALLFTKKRSLILLCGSSSNCLIIICKYCPNDRRFLANDDCAQLQKPHRTKKRRPFKSVIWLIKTRFHENRIEANEKCWLTESTEVNLHVHFAFASIVCGNRSTKPIDWSARVWLGSTAEWILVPKQNEFHLSDWNKPNRFRQCSWLHYTVNMYCNKKGKIIVVF